MTDKEELEREAEELAQKCTHLQRRFAQNYASGMTMVEAYKKAGGTAKSKSSQETSASALMSNSKCKAYYNHLAHMAMLDSIMTREEALARLSGIARVTVADVMSCDLEEYELESGEKGQYMKFDAPKLDELPPHVLNAIKGVTMTRQGPKYELIGQSDAIKQIRAMEGWDAPKKTEHSGPNGAPLDFNAHVSSEDVVNAVNDLKDFL